MSTLSTPTPPGSASRCLRDRCPRVRRASGSEQQLQHHPDAWAQTDGTGPAAQFDGGSVVKINGNLNVTGSISAGVKDFKIDDPLAPATKSLVHTSVESPQAENVYNGNITTDGKGYATVQLPPYFDAENTSPRYQLTVIGSFAQAIVWKQEHNNQFVVRTNQPHVQVSWQITGVRNDPYSRSQQGPAEQPKSAADRGRYLYPQGYGKPLSDAIGSATRGRHAPPKLPRSAQHTAVPGPGSSSPRACADWAGCRDPGAGGRVSPAARTGAAGAADRAAFRELIPDRRGPSRAAPKPPARSDALTHRLLSSRTCAAAANSRRSSGGPGSRTRSRSSTSTPDQSDPPRFAVASRWRALP